MIEARLNGVFAKCLAVSALSLALTACNGFHNPNAMGTPATAAFNGNFVFSVAGTDPTDGDYFVVGRFNADGNGNITNGVADYNLGSGIDSAVPLTGTYTVTSGVASFKLVGAGFSDTFTSAMISSGTAAISAFDGNGSGTLYSQTTTGFTTTGSYSYTVKGEGQGTVTGSGSLLASGASGTFASGTLSYMDGSTLMTYGSVTGFLLPPQTNGRGQGALVGDNFAYYVVSPSSVLMVGLDEKALLLVTATKP